MKPELDQIICGDNVEVMRGFDDCNFDTCVTSPPYYGLRDYGMDGQIGLEDSPELYVERLVNVFREVKRVLKDDGTLWLNLGDSYWGGKGSNANLDTNIDERVAEGRTLQRPKTRIEGMKVLPTNGKHPIIKAKDLVGIPWMVAFALRADGWYLRSEIIWHKPNPMPESVTDRPTKSHEQIFLFSKNARYYYDADAVLEPYIEPMNRWGGPALKRETNKTQMLNEIKKVGNSSAFREGRPMRPNPNGRNKRSVWTVPTVAYKGAHFATFPPDLIVPCILAGSRVGGIVLDPFGGSGTTGFVARELGRYFLLTDLNPEYCKLAEKRVAGANVPLFVE